MTRRKVIQVYVPKEVEPFILRLERELGLSRSDIFFIAFMDYLKEIGLLKTGLLKRRIVSM